MSSWQPIDIPLNDLTIRGCRSGQGGSRRVLCIHGWLDNANSFKAMQSELHGCDLVAIDLPGHGQSDHFNNHVPYTIASAMHYVLQCAEKLGWPEFHLIGHSLGGGIAPLCAAAAPDLVQSLVLIDALGPVAENEDKLPARLARFHSEMKSHSTITPRIMESAEQAADIRLKATKMNRSSALAIVERQLTKTDTGLRWSFDNKLRVASPSYFTEAQIQHILSTIKCPVLCIIAEAGYQADNKLLEPRSACVVHLQLERLPGNHHLHMDNPAPVATAITKFWQQS